MILQPPSALPEGRQIIAGFADLPPKPPRSKLEPHRDLIRELRRKGQTYRDVARLFQEWLGLYVAPSTLHSLVKVRAKHRKRSQFELPPMELIAIEASPVLDRVEALKDRTACSAPRSQHRPRYWSWPVIPVFSREIRQN